MKFYVSGDLDEELFDEYALERCKECPYCYLENDGSHTCKMSYDTFNIEEEILFDDGSLECWIP